MKILPVPFQYVIVLEFLMMMMMSLIVLDLVPFLEKKIRRRQQRPWGRQRQHELDRKRINRTTSRHELDEQHLSFSNTKIGCSPITIVFLLF